MVLDYRSVPLEPALAAMEASRANTMSLLKRLPKEAWSSSGTHTESGEYSAETWLEIYAEYLEIHLKQIERNLEQSRTDQAEYGCGYR
jgi:hypothetical protein